jgi:hypothetical protein
MLERRGEKHNPELFSKVPYHGRSGLLDKLIMDAELQGADLARALGIPTQRNLAVAELKQLPNSDGIFTSINTLQQQGFIESDLNPVILVRAMRSNFRIIDFVNLFDRNDVEGLNWLIAETKKLHLNDLGPNPSNQKLFTFLVKQLAEGALKICFAGLSMNVYFADDFARNVTVAGEFIDLDDLRKTSGNYPSSTTENFGRHLKMIMQISISLGHALSSVSDRTISMKPSTIYFVDQLIRKLKSGDANHLYESLSQSWKNELSISRFRYEILRQAVSYFYDYSFHGEFRKQSESTSRAVKQYLANKGLER